MPNLPTSNVPSEAGRVFEDSKQVDDASDGSTPKAGYPLQTDDAVVVHTVLERRIIESGKTILVIAHSAGV